MSARIVTGGWVATLPSVLGQGVGPATRECLLEPLSLTDRLVGSGRAFTVDVLQLGQDEAGGDEADQMGVAPGAPVLARHVALKLDGTIVVVARSYCRWQCPVWTPVLDRGSRSLGYTLFSGEVPVRLDPLEFRAVAAGHGLFNLAAGFDAAPVDFPARRRRFLLDGAAMVVCEVFLPVLEARMRPGRAIQAAPTGD